MTDKTVDLVKLLAGIGGNKKQQGLKMVTVNTTEPGSITFVFDGMPMAIDADIFEIPVNMYPLRKGDRFLAYPLIGEHISQRWGLIQKINAGLVFGTMLNATSLTIDGINKTYTAADLKTIPGLQAGDKVLLAPVKEGSAIKYAILQRY